MPSDELRARAAIYVALAIYAYMENHRSALMEDIIFHYDPYSSNKALRDEQIISDATTKLRKLGIIEVEQDNFGPLLLIWKKYFTSVVIDTISDDDAPIVKRYFTADAVKDKWLKSALNSIGDTWTTVGKPSASVIQDKIDPAADSWSPLPLDRTSEVARDAIQKSEKALQEIEQSNGYASSEPEERNGIVETIKGTLAAVKSGSPSRQAILAGLIAPFRYIAKKFTDASMGESAKIAVAALIKWLFL